MPEGHDGDDDSPLAALARLADQAGADGVAADARALGERVREGRFHVALVGQFKRGKSTLINALVAEDILPVGVVPVTAVVTVVRHGPQRGARVQLHDGAWRAIDPADLGSYVSEEGNPDNAKGVAGVEVFAPSPLLSSGMCLVDTPGLGSVFAGGTAATRAFVPHVDAALVVLGADPPISEDELTLVEEVARHVHELVFVLNKADRVSDGERSEAKAFTERVVAGRLHRNLAPIFELSATERIAGAADPRDWASLYGTLERLATEAGSTLVEAAERRGRRLLAERLRRELDKDREALSRPVEESERRIESLRRCAADAERAMQDLGYLMTAEQERLGKQFAARKEMFLVRRLPGARDELSEAIRKVGSGRALRQKADTLALEISRRRIDRWLAEERPAAEALYRQGAQRFVDLANECLERLASSGEPALAGLSSVGPDIGFRVRSRLYYTELWGLTARPPWGWLPDLFRSRAAMRRAVDRDAGEYLKALIDMNATRIENDFSDRLLESGRLLESEIRVRLKEVHASAERALAKARATQAAGAEAIRVENERLGAIAHHLDALTTNGGTRT
jgi:GTP-binding protein EngB required for normal cell division